MARSRRRLIVKDRKKTALGIALGILLLLVLAGVITLVCMIVRKTQTKAVVRELPISQPEIISGTGDGLLYVKSGMLNFLSFKDEDLNFTRGLRSGAAPAGVAGTEGIKVVYSDQMLQIVGTDFDTTPAGRVIAVRCGRTHVAVCNRAANGRDTVTVFTSAGQNVKEFEFKEGALMDFGFSEASGSTIWTMELSADSGSPRTTISTFDLDRMSSTGVINVSGQLVERVFFTSSSVFVVGTESLIRYSASANREVYRVQLFGYRVADISLTGEAPLLMLVPRNAEDIEEARSIRLLKVQQKDVAGESAVTVTLPAPHIGCCLVNGYLAAVTPTSVILYDSAGEETSSRAMPMGATTSFEKLDEHHILLERSGEYVLLTVGK